MVPIIVLVQRLLHFKYVVVDFAKKFMVNLHMNTNSVWPTSKKYNIKQYETHCLCCTNLISWSGDSRQKKIILGQAGDLLILELKTKESGRLRYTFGGNLGAHGEWKFHWVILHIFQIITVIWYLLDVKWAENVWNAKVVSKYCIHHFLIVFSKNKTKHIPVKEMLLKSIKGKISKIS